MNFIITATHDRGQLHIGVDDGNQSKTLYLGKLDVYRNLFSRFFSKLFGMSQEVVINGKVHHVNKKSLQAHFQTINIKDSSLFKKDYNSFFNEYVSQDGSRATEDQIAVPEISLSSNLSEEKKLKLFDKLIRQLTSFTNSEQEERIKRTIRKGAPLDRKAEKILNTQTRRHTFVNTGFYRLAEDFAIKKQATITFDPLILAIDKKYSEDLKSFIKARLPEDAIHVKSVEVKKTVSNPRTNHYGFQESTVRRDIPYNKQDTAPQKESWVL